MTPSAEPTSELESIVKGLFLSSFEIDHIFNETEIQSFSDIMISYTPFLESQLWRSEKTAVRSLTQSKIQTLCEVTHQETNFDKSLNLVRYHMEFTSRHTNVQDFPLRFKNYLNLYKVNVTVDFNKAGVKVKGYNNAIILKVYGTPQPTSIPSLLYNFVLYSTTFKSFN